jgi:hypothetical protein
LIQNKRLLLAAIPSEHLSEFTLAYSTYEESNHNHETVVWFLNRLLTYAEDTGVIRKALPQYYHKYIVGIDCNGTATIDQMYNQECFNILEQIQLNNLILGITNDK